MNLQIHSSYEQLSDAAANIVIELLNEKPKSLICIPGGDTPKGMLEKLVLAYQEKKVDFSECEFIGLDEWVGMDSSSEGSCQNFLYSNFFNQVNAQQENIHFFNAMSEDLQNECKKIDDLILTKSGLDLIFLGVGLNGHLGFNEPGVSFDLYSHVSELDNTTKTVGQKYFSVQTALKKGITLGIKHILEAKKAVLMANGAKKAEIIHKTLNQEVNSEIPSTAIKLHKNAIVMIDKEAAEKIS